jgi:hypothetical protein
MEEKRRFGFIAKVLHVLSHQDTQISLQITAVKDSLYSFLVVWVQAHGF